jgi:hypothetical protein
MLGIKGIWTNFMEMIKEITITNKDRGIMKNNLILLKNI